MKIELTNLEISLLLDNLKNNISGLKYSIEISKKNFDILEQTGENTNNAILELTQKEAEKNKLSTLLKKIEKQVY